MSEQDAIQYSYINNGANPVSVKTSSQYSYVNNGVLQTRDDGATGYNYIDVIEPPSQLWMSDGSDWFHVVLDYEMEEAIKVSEDNTGMFIGQMISDQGLPTGGSAGQVLKKLSDDNYDAVWATDSGGSGGVGIPAGGSAGEVLTKGSNLDGDASWEMPPRELPSGGTAGQILSKISDTDGDVEWKSGGGSGSVVVRNVKIPGPISPPVDYGPLGPVIEIPSSVGDLVELGVNLNWGNTTAEYGYLDATIVDGSGTKIRKVGASWLRTGAHYHQSSGSRFTTLTSTDLPVAGLLRVQFIWKLPSAQDTYGDPELFVKNFGPQ